MKFTATFPRALALFLGTALTLAAQPQTPDLNSLEARLKKLESQVDTLRQENQGLRQQLGVDAKGVAPVRVGVLGKETKLAIGGYLQTQAEFGDAADSRFPANNRFLLRRARLGIKGTFAEGFDFVLQSDWGNNSLNSTSGFRAQLSDAYVVWTKHAFANVTLGQFKVPYGYDQLLPDTKGQTIERSLPNDMLTLPRQAGVMVAGSFFQKKLGYAAAVVNGNGTNVSFNDNEQFTSLGRVFATAFDRDGVKLNLGVNGYTGRDTGTFTGRRTGRGADAQLYFARAELDAEILHTHFDRDVGADTDAQGWSLAGSYFFVPNKWQGIVRYESYDPNTDVASDQTTLRTIGVTYFVKGDDLKLQFNYLLGTPPNSSQNQGRFIGRMQLVF